MNRLDVFKHKEGVAFPIGSQLDRISKVCAEVFGDKVIKIKLPYRDFNCHGPASEIAKDVLYLMPFRGGDVSGQDKTTTLFYGEIKVCRGNHIPFQADVDTFYISEVEEFPEPTITLVEAPCWRAYL